MEIQMVQGGEGLGNDVHTCVCTEDLQVNQEERLTHGYRLVDLVNTADTAQE
jgi:hypothetical protein